MNSQTLQTVPDSLTKVSSRSLSFASLRCDNHRQQKWHTLKSLDSSPAVVFHKSSTMVLFTWRAFLPFVIVASLLIYEEWVAIPSCQIVPGTNKDWNYGDAEDLKVMMVANLLLLGRDAGFVNMYFRDYYMSKFFRKSFQSLKPDMLLVLGDVSARGAELTKSKWVSVLHQFHQMLGPFLSLPFHVVLGDRDVGECNGLDPNSVFWIARNLPGLDSSGCGAFEISNVNFVSLNAVALLCGNNKLRFSVESVIERESIELQTESEGSDGMINQSSEYGEMFGDFGLRENTMISGSGPVLLLHFPLHHSANGKCRKDDALTRAPNSSQRSSNTLKSRGFIGIGPYELFHNVPLNATEYIFQALKPRIIFSAHTHEFCDHTHTDGTREVTVPAMTWNARDDPGFVVANFQKNRAVSVSYCTLARESHVVTAYMSAVVLLLSTWLLANSPDLRCLR